MKIRSVARAIYWWGLRTFIYNQVNEKLFFPQGRTKGINDARILLPFRFFWYYPNTYEAAKTDFINSICQEGDNVIDIGAHIGVFSFFMAKAVGKTGRVYSFEPSPFTFTILSQVLKWNKLSDQVVAYNQAISDKTGHAHFYIYDNSKISNGNSFSSHNTTGNRYAIDIETIDLDSFAEREKLKSVKLLKIDAEGAELSILKGAKKLIKNFHPYITLEVHPRSFDDREKTMCELFEIIQSFKYRITKDSEPLSRESFEAKQDCFEVLLLPMP